MAIVRNPILTCAGCHQDMLHGLDHRGFYCLLCDTVHTNPHILDLDQPPSSNASGDNVLRRMSRDMVP